MSARVLVTGAAGFLGSHLAIRLGLNHEVWGLVRRTRGAIREITQDLEAAPPWPPWPVRFDVVVHAAGRVGEDRDVAESAYASANTDATMRLFDHALAAGAQVFVFLSSGAVYGPAPAPCAEHRPLRPEGAYARSKLAAETALVARAGLLRTHCLRLFFPYGEGQGGRRLIPGLAARIEAGEAVWLRNPAGTPLLNPVHVDDVTELVLRVVERGGPSVLNVAGQETVSVRTLSDKIATRLGREPRFHVGSEPEALDYVGDTTLAREALGFEPRIRLDEGLDRVLADRRAHRQTDGVEDVQP